MPVSGLAFQDIVALRLTERDAREKAHDEIIANYQRLARHAAALQSRSAGLGQGQGLAKAVPTPAVSEGPSDMQPPSLLTSSSSDTARQAQITSLEAQLASTREELSQLYKTQSQNAQRLLLLTEQMKEKEDSKKSEAADVRSLKEQVDKYTRRERDLRDAAGEKDKVIEMLQDELRTLSLELNQVEARNDDLKRDNASLLQRWLDRARDEAEKVNEANKFLEEIEKRKAGGNSADE
ncbi:unnamed protein product [Sympodiomycopsis kandeliae]